MGRRRILRKRGIKKQYVITYKTHSCQYNFIYPVYVDERGVTRTWPDGDYITYDCSRLFGSRKEAREAKRRGWETWGELEQPKRENPLLKTSALLPERKYDAKQ